MVEDDNLRTGKAYASTRFINGEPELCNFGSRRAAKEVRMLEYSSPHRAFDCLISLRAHQEDIILRDNYRGTVILGS